MLHSPIEITIQSNESNQYNPGVLSQRRRN
jgi:hypothetical protein